METNNQTPKKSLMFNAFLLTIVIHTNQTGVGIAGLPRVVYLESSHDAWISILIAGVVIHLILYVMIMILKSFEDKDILAIHHHVYGKLLGKLVNFIYSLYLIAAFFIIILNYVEIVQAWLFPDLKAWLLSFMLISLAIYAVMGGVRVVVGVAFVSFCLSFWLVLMIYAPLKYIDFWHYLPILSAPPKELFMGAFKTSLSVLGFEILFFLWPYIKDKKNAAKFSHFGVLLTTVLFTLITLVTIGFFSDDGLKRTIWPLLSIFKIIEIPNLERFEFLAISFWMLIILPNTCLFLWAATKGLKGVFNIQQKKLIWVVGGIVWLGTFFVKARVDANSLTNYVANFGFAIGIVYPFLLGTIVLIQSKLKRSANK